MISWIDIAWPMMASASLTLGLIHGFVWMRHGSRANLAFAIIAMSIAALSLLELLAMRATTPAEFGTLVRWMHLPVTILTIALVWFFHEFSAARHFALGLGAAAFRMLALALNFTTGENLNFRTILEVRQTEWWGGELVSYAVGVANPWIAVAQVSNVLLIAYMVMALASAWRAGEPDRRRAFLVVSVAWLFFIGVMVASGVLMTLGVVKLPFLGSPGFLAVVFATSYLLGLDLSRSAQLAEQLRQTQSRALQTERDLNRIADAGGLELWLLDVAPAAAKEPAHFPAGGEAATEHGMSVGSFLARVHEDDRGAVEAAVAKALGNGLFESEFRQILADGGVRWISARGEVEFDAQSRPRRIRAISKNVNENHAAAERFRNLFESAPIAIMLVDSQGRISLANDLVAEIFGSSRAAIEGSLLETLVAERHRHAHVALRMAFTSQTTTRMAGGRALFGRRADGSEVPVEVALKQVEFSDGVYTLTTVTDITARQRAESEAARQVDELAHLSRVTMIGELSGALAHELNQPLAAIMSNAQAAQRILTNTPEDTTYLHEILADIVDDDRRAGEVIRRMRSLLKKGHVDHAPVDINALVVDVLRLIRNEMIHRGVDVIVDLARGTPLVEADPIQLQQVLVNLLFNACDAMEGLGGTRIVRVRTRPTSEGAVTVSVEDGGAGIPPGMLERIFEPFETTKPQGMGLGLAVCRSILEAHGGRIWAENLDGGGARVSFEVRQLGNTA